MSTPLIPVVSVHDGKPVTTSLIVAEHFGKRHDHVLRDIDELLTQLPDSFDKPNFGEVAREVKIGLGFTRKERYFELTRDAFTLLAMGFTGAQALKFKVAFLDAFNRTETELRELLAAPALPAPAAPLPAKLHAVPVEEYIGLLKDKIALLELQRTARPRRRPFSAEERAEISRRAAAGETPASIGKAIGRSSDSVATYLRAQRRREVA